MQSQESNSWKIDLPGGGFIQKPGAQLRPVSGEVSMAHTGLGLFDGRTNRVFLAHNKCSLWFSCQIDLPGGGFIQKPGAQLRPVSGEVSMAHTGYWLFNGRTNRAFLAHNKCLLWFSCQIDLPGGGFIQKPGAQLRPVSGEVSMTHAGYWLFDGRTKRVIFAHNKCFLVVFLQD